MLHQQHLLRLLGRHQLGVLVSAGGEGLLQVGRLLVQSRDVGLVILLGDSAKRRGSGDDSPIRITTRLRTLN